MFFYYLLFFFCLGYTYRFTDGEYYTTTNNDFQQVKLQSDLDSVFFATPIDHIKSYSKGLLISGVKKDYNYFYFSTFENYSNDNSFVFLNHNSTFKFYDSVYYFLYDLGDFNGDGYADFLEIHQDSNLDYIGTKLILGKKTDSKETEIKNYFGQEIKLYSSLIFSKKLGSKLSNGFDVDGDSYYDLLLGVTSSFKETVFYLIYGRANINSNQVNLDDSQEINVLRFIGTSDFDFTFLNDVNGNSRFDLAYSYLNSSGENIVYILDGSTLYSSKHGIVDALDPIGFRKVKLFSNSCPDNVLNLGNGGDLDRDGFNDLVISCPSAKSGSGYVSIHYGEKSLINSTTKTLDDDDSIESIYYFGLKDQGLGTTLHGTFDIDNDGYDDFLFGSAESDRSGSLGVIYGGKLYNSYKGNFEFSGTSPFHTVTLLCPYADKMFANGFVTYFRVSSELKYSGFLLINDGASVLKQTSTSGPVLLEYEESKERFVDTSLNPEFDDLELELSPEFEKSLKNSKSRFFTCPAGFVPSIDQDDCEECGPTFFSIPGESINCEVCPPGFIPSENRSDCVQCPENEVAVPGLSVECEKCSGGKVPSKNRSACVNSSFILRLGALISSMILFVLFF